MYEKSDPFEVRQYHYKCQNKKAHFLQYLSTVHDSMKTNSNPKLVNVNKFFAENEYNELF